MKRSRFFNIVLIIALIVGIERFSYRARNGFSIGKVQRESTLNPQWQIAPLQDPTLLQQRFTYLGSGGTSFAFLGEDKKTILKLIKQHHLQGPQWLLRLPLPGFLNQHLLKTYIQRELKHQHKRLPYLFTSCKIAYENLREETGLVYLALQGSEPCKVELIDRLGFSHTVDLSQTSFALQRYATPLFAHLEALLKDEKAAQIKSIMDQLLDLISLRCERGISDRDPNLLINFGVTAKRVIEYDLGSYALEPALRTPAAQKRELYLATFALRAWLEKRAPSLLNEYEHLLAQRLAVP